MVEYLLIAAGQALYAAIRTASTICMARGWRNYVVLLDACQVIVMLCILRSVVMGGVAEVAAAAVGQALGSFLAMSIKKFQRPVDDHLT